MPIPPSNQGGRLIADGLPGLGPLSGIEVNWGSLAAHPCARPAGIHCVAQDLRPAPGQREGERDDVQLAFRVGAGAVPRALFLVEVGQ